MKIAGKFNIDNKAEVVISSFDYTASALSYLYEDLTDANGSLASCLPVIVEGLQDIYSCNFDIIHVSTPYKSLSEFFQTYLSGRAPSTRQVSGMSMNSRAFFSRRNTNSFKQNRVNLLERRPNFGGDYDNDDAMASPFILEFSQNGGFVFENATPNDFVVQVFMKQKGGTDYGEFLLTNLVNSKNSYFKNLQSVSDIKYLMNTDPNKFNKHLSSALQNSFVDRFTNLYIESINAKGNEAGRLLNVAVDWKQDRTTITFEVGIIIQDFKL